jgi:hypothetical protein
VHSFTRSLPLHFVHVSTQFEAALKATAKRSEEERRKAATKERQDLERMMAEQLNKVGCVSMLRVCFM